MTDALRSYLQEIEDLKAIRERIWLDQQQGMPPGAIADRTRQIGIIAGMVQDRLTAPELGRLLDAAPDESWVGVARRDRERALRMQGGLWRRFQETSSDAFDAWVRARDGSDWSIVQPGLEKLVGIYREYAETVGYDEHPMDALLSVYEPGPTHAEITSVFDSLRDFLIHARARRVVDAPTSAIPVERHVLVEIMRAIGRLIGFDFQRGDVGYTPHGYTSIAGPRDARVTVATNSNLFQGVLIAIHEYGHALYGLGVSEELWGTPAQHGSMPYIQESQSKFWENIVGRREDFSVRIGEILTDHVGEWEPERWGAAFHGWVTRSPANPIRIHADEISFNLHIMLRYELETQLIEGKLAVADVPDAWNALSEHYLGFVPENERLGCLQDPHWVTRFFGLFTAYIVGNVSSAQLAATMESQGTSITDAVARADFNEVLGWLRRNVHAPGRTVTVQEMLRNVTGKPLDATHYLEHLRSRYREIA